MWGISIHSLRMEGDGAITTPGYVGDISIHSLRMEGDSRHCACGRSQLHFNPLPPHGGRLPFSNRRFTDSTFQSTPSAWRETHWHNGQSITRQFQSTPSAWRETSQVLGVDLSGDYCSLPRKTQKTDTQNEKNAPEHHVQERFLLPINGVLPLFYPFNFSSILATCRKICLSVSLLLVSFSVSSFGLSVVVVAFFANPFSPAALMIAG